MKDSLLHRAEQIQDGLADPRGRRVVFVSHCLLNQNVRYLGGASQPGGLRQLVTGYLNRGIGICQLPCPEQHAWGGVRKRRMLIAFGSGGTWRAPVVRMLLRPFTWYTRRVYARLARQIAREVTDYRRSGIEVVALVGVGGSPSCGVRRALNLPEAVAALTRCPAARLDRRTLNEDIMAAHVRPGEGLFIRALRRRLSRAGAPVPLEEHDLLAELGLARGPVSGRLPLSNRE